MHTPFAAASTSASADLPLLDADPQAPGPKPRGWLRGGLDVFDHSAKAAARWSAGTLGLGLVASASYYLPHAPGHQERAIAVGGGLAGTALYALGTGELWRAAHSPSEAAGQAPAQHAFLALSGVVVGSALAGADHATLGTVGLLGAYYSAFVGASVLTHRLIDQQVAWRQAGHDAPHGSRWLAGSMLLLAAGTLGLGWVAAALGAAVTHHSAQAVTGRFVGAFVNLTALLQALPHLIWPPSPASADPAQLAPA